MNIEFYFLSSFTIPRRPGPWVSEDEHNFELRFVFVLVLYCESDIAETRTLVYFVMCSKSVSFSCIGKILVL